ncbi:2,5-didehydrogluconate reductase DkgB [Vibrio maritimus]|uniref:2,5-didehydrogluconate reductase DkgB n=1 Tax=Vibrio maritimus TaxID=990268 RepID=UPI00406871EA
MSLSIPTLGAGTFRLKGDDAYNSVKMALEAGYRHIDTAQIYGNEKEVGQAIADSGIARDELFVTTKIWMDKLGKDSFIPSLDESLKDLQLEHVDLLLIHWPLKDEAVPMKEYLQELKHAQDSGLARYIGVSNFTVAQMKQAIEILGEGVLYTNQVEVHPYLQNAQVVDFCKQNEMIVTGYMPFAYGDVLKDGSIKHIAEKHGATPAQVVLAWMAKSGFVTIPSSTKKANIESNLGYVDVVLNDEDMATIANLDRGHRLANPDFAPEWD